MRPGFPEGQPFPLTPAAASSQRTSPGNIIGVSVNLHNNLWNMNSPLFYPFYDPRFCSSPDDCTDSNLKFRFRLHLGADQDWQPREVRRRRHKKEEGLDPLSLFVVVSVAGVGVLLAVRAMHNENAGEVLLDDLQDLEDDDNGGGWMQELQMLSLRGRAGMGGLRPPLPTFNVREWR